jgi:hypothetical protein
MITIAGFGEGPKFSGIAMSRRQEVLGPERYPMSSSTTIRFSGTAPSGDCPLAGIGAARAAPSSVAYVRAHPERTDRYLIGDVLC